MSRAAEVSPCEPDTCHHVPGLECQAALLAQLQSHGVPSADLEHAARVAMFVIEGLLAHPTSTKDRRALVRWLVSMVPTTAERA
jgi:hypothetical protein